MGETDSVFQIITNSGENKVVTFCDKSGEVYAYAKSEIIDFIDKLDNETLLNLRKTLFSKLSEIFAQYKRNDLYARRSKSLLVEDIYIIGYSVISKMEDKRLKKILKGDPALESQSDLIDDKDIFETCVDQKISSEILRVRFNQLEKKVHDLEDEVTSLKLTILGLTEKHEQADVSLQGGEISDEDEDSSNDISVVSDNSEPGQPNQPLEPQIVIKNVLVESKSKAEVKPASTLSSNEKDTPKATESGFRYTKGHRRKIVDGPKKKPSSSRNSRPTEKPTAVTGCATVPLRVEAADNSEILQPRTCHVYVGHLARDTTEDAIRAHLNDIGVHENYIEDVIKLKCRKNTESSFCISLCDMDAETKVYDPSNWPSNVRRRPFNQKKSHSQLLSEFLSKTLCSDPKKYIMIHLV